MSESRKATEFNGRKLLSGEGEVVDIQVGLHDDPTLDRISYETAKTNTTLGALNLTDISVADKASAQHNLTGIDQAIKIVNENRSEFGALQNRLQSTINNLQIYDENISGARSRIFDVDMAAETAELTKNNILTTAGTAVLAQANQNNMLALKLIS